MQKYLMMAGVLFAALGVALGLMALVSPGIGLDAAATLLVGGAVTIGLGGVIQALEARPKATPPEPVQEEPTQPPPETPQMPPAVLAVETVAVLEDLPAPPSPVEIIVEEPKPEPPPAPVKDPSPAAEPQLFVTEERVIRNCAARLLSDGTVEAQTEEGWMRFENLEHLDEYLDAMAPIKRL